jgi:hypothetical protein
MTFGHELYLGLHASFLCKHRRDQDFRTILLYFYLRLFIGLRGRRGQVQQFDIFELFLVIFVGLRAMGARPEN